MRSLLAILAPVLILSGCISADFGDSDAVQSELHERFPVMPNAHVEVANISGPITVIPWNSPEIDIVARKHGDNLDALRNTSVQITRDGTPPDNVDVDTHYLHDRFFFWGHNGVSVDYTLHVPRGISLRVRSVSGDIRVSDLGGNVDINNVSGEVSALGVGGDLRINTVSGSVDASLARMGEDANVEVQAVSGSLTLAIPPRSGAIVTADSISGSFDSDFPIVARRRTVGFEANGRIGDGSGSVELHTISGSITLSKT